MPFFTDPRDGKAYKTVVIGDQIWMAENLNYDAEGSKFYDNNPANGDIYGKLYNWDTAKKAAPPGWHLPTYSEWETLLNFAGGEKISTTDYGIAGKKLKAKSGWSNDGNGTDIYGFSAMPGGYFCNVWEFKNAGGVGRWWKNSCYEYKGIRNASFWHMNWDSIMCSVSESQFYEWGYSIRCIKDRKKDAKKQKFWDIFSILLGGIIGGAVFAFLHTEAGEKDFISGFTMLIGILGFLLAFIGEWIGGDFKLGNVCLGCIGGLIIGVIIAFIFSVLLSGMPFIVSTFIGVIVGALLGRSFNKYQSTQS